MQATAQTDAREGHDDLVYDIGMNICEDTDFYLRKGFKVIAVEANPTTCEEAARRYPREIAAGQLTVLNRAISETREPLTFYVCKTMSAWSTASPELRDYWTRRGAIFEAIQVQGVITSDIVEEFGTPHYAKIDIEGFDLVCLGGFRKETGVPRYVSVEVDFKAVDQLLRTAEDLGYRRFALVGQAGVPQQAPSRPAREGCDIDYAFPRGSTGLFGRELPAEWVRADHIRSQCAKIIRQYRVSGILGRAERVLPPLKPMLDKVRAHRLPLSCDWYDLHASF
jgi:FkbM family methyltransferase